MPHTVQRTWHPQTQCANSHDIKKIILGSLLWIHWVLSCIIFPPLNTAVCPIFLQFYYVSFVLNVLIFKLCSDIWTNFIHMIITIFLFYKGNEARLHKSIQQTQFNRCIYKEMYGNICMQELGKVGAKIYIFMILG